MKKTSDATHPANRIEVTVWLSVKEAAKKLSVSTDTIERRAACSTKCSTNDFEVGVNLT
jgi:hypothetical protein